MPPSIHVSSHPLPSSYIQRKLCYVHHFCHRSHQTNLNWNLANKRMMSPQNELSINFHEYTWGTCHQPYLLYHLPCLKRLRFSDASKTSRFFPSYPSLNLTFSCTSIFWFLHGLSTRRHNFSQAHTPGSQQVHHNQIISWGLLICNWGTFLHCWFSLFYPLLS